MPYCELKNSIFSLSAMSPIERLLQGKTEFVEMKADFLCLFPSGKLFVDFVFDGEKHNQ